MRLAVVAVLIGIVRLVLAAATMGKADTMKRTAIERVRTFLALVIVLGIGSRAEAQCSASTPSSSTSQRKIQVNLACPGASFFELSETPDFKESDSTGVAIEIINVDPNNEFVDISVTYPAGTPTFPAQPFRVPTETKSPRVLGVLVDFDDGYELTLPQYATPAFLNRLLFSGNHDGRLLYNSLGAWLQHNSYGVVSLAGNVYPGVVHLDPVSVYRPYLGVQGMFKAVADNLVATGYIDPLNNPYDILIIYSAGGLATSSADFYNYNSYWQYKGFEKVLQVDIPIDSTSVLYSQIQNEAAVVNSDGVVVTKYNPGGTTASVWLTADVNHTGTNYFASMAWAFQGGVPSISNQLIRYIKLNQPLSPGTSVIVTYQPHHYFKIDEATRIALPPDTLFGDNLNWFGLISHEFMHLAGSLLTTSWSVSPNMGIGDLYDQPWELIREYDIMAGGGYTATYAFNPYLNKSIRYDTPTHFNGYTKVQMGLLAPYTVGYGRNETSLRLYRTEEVDFLSSENRIKLIRVPLRPPGDKIGMQLVGYNNTATKKYYGDDFLILEWRSKAPFSDGKINFDEPLPSEGLVIYRALDGGPSPANSSYYHGNHEQNNIAIQDATPPLPPYASLNDYTVVRQSSISTTSPATFGPASGVYRYLASEVQSWKNAGDTANLDIQLSAGAGTKTVYAKFMDLSGNIVGISSFEVTLNEADTMPPTAPTALTAVSVSSSQVNLSWNASSDAVGVTGYDIFRNGVFLRTVTGLTSSDTGLAASTSYSYFVKARDAAGNPSGPSSTVFVTTQAPSVTTATITGTVSNSAGVAVASAKIEVGSGKSKKTYYVNSNGQYTISGLAAGTYTLTLSARGYVAQSISVTFSAGQTLTRNVTLQAR
jgi:chitodextrinase